MYIREKSLENIANNSLKNIDLKNERYIMKFVQN